MDKEINELVKNVISCYMKSNNNPIAFFDFIAYCNVEMSKELNLYFKNRSIIKKILKSKNSILRDEVENQGYTYNEIVGCSCGGELVKNVD